MQLHARQGFGLSGSSNGAQHKFIPALRTCKPTRHVTKCASAAPVATEEAAGIKAALTAELEGLNRGIFGIKSANKEKVHALVADLEALNPVEAPTEHLDQVEGRWRLLYSTISILGSKRTKLGLREFVKLGDLFQDINLENSSAVNEIEFAVSGLGLLKGALTIEATYEPVSASRVEIKYASSSLVPEQFQKIFEKNLPLLLGLFNPEGWLDITYLDATHRVGRDDKGNIFLLERVAAEE